MDTFELRAALDRAEAEVHETHLALIAIEEGWSSGKGVSLSGLGLRLGDAERNIMCARTCADELEHEEEPKIAARVGGLKRVRR